MENDTGELTGRHCFMSTEEAVRTTGEARYGMVIDLDRCNGCGACMAACAVENNVPPAAEKANERTGISWLRVERLTNGAGYPDNRGV